MDSALAAGALGGGTADTVLIAWFVLAVLSAAYVAFDAFTRNPELTVMKWGWVLVTLYIGPVGAAHAHVPWQIRAMLRGTVPICGTVT